MKYRVLAFGGALVLVSALAFVTVLRPQAARIADVREQVRLQQDRLEELNLDLRRLQALREEASALRARAQRVDTAVPDTPQLGEFVLQVQEAGRLSAVDWLSVSPTAPAAGQEGGVSEINVSLTFTGGYFQVEDFVARLETLGRAVKISQVTLGPGPAGLPQLSASLSLKMFVATRPAT